MIRTLRSATALTLVLAFGSPALAADAQALADSITRQLAKSAVTFTVESAEEDGDDVVLKGVTIKPGDNNPAEIAEIRLKDVEESDDRFRVGEIEAPEMTVAKEGKTLDFAGASFTGLIVPKENNTDPLLSGSMMLEGAEIGELSVTDGDKTVFAMEGASYSATPYEPGAVMDTSLEINGLQADFSTVEDPKVRGTMAALGYEQLAGDVSLKGSWNPADGRMQITEYKLDVDDAAAINLTLDIGGMTSQFIQQANELVAKQRAGEIKEEAMGFAMLGLMQQLSLNGAQLRLDDASLTGKLLDFAAAQQGAKREDVVNMAKGMMPMFLMRLQNPDFATKTANAAGAYLDDPQSLTVTVAPANPVPFAQIMGAAMSAPNTIPDVLGVAVTAND
ncbi:MAG: hypothetical protein KDJ74_01545 [Notoacmeibacter sp.]|nr:hypothetical protein [Notoacmeibacter sp.]